MMTHEQPLVSVIMPCYNDGAFLPEAIASVQAQTYEPIELIIIDDGSDHVETLQALKAIHFQNHHILHTNHIGPAAARNAGIQAAHGDFILPLDADDKIDPDYIEKAMRVMQSDPSIGIVYCYADFFGEKEGLWEGIQYSLEKELVGNCIFVTALFRKEDWKQAGGFCTAFVAGLEDYDFWLTLIEKGRIVYQIPEVLFHYRIKKNSRSSAFNGDGKEMEQTYQLLYDRHHALYEKHMDLYCTALRNEWITSVLQIQQYASDPAIMYWLSVKAFKPRRANRFLWWLRFKKSIKERLGRA